MKCPVSPPPCGSVWTCHLPDARVNFETLNILLVDDHRMFREGLRMLIGRELPGAAVEQARKLRPDIILMDLHLPDGNGIDASRKILADLPGARVIILSSDTSLAFVREALLAGIAGYLLKSGASDELPEAIRTVLDGRLHLCSEANRVAVEDYKETLAAGDASHRHVLSARELQVLRLVAEGLRTKEIADRIGVEVSTAEVHRKRLMRKLGCDGVVGLVRYAIREGIVPP